MTREIYGTPDQIRMQERGAALWTLLRGDPAYCYMGRMVTLAGPQPDTAARLAALARVQSGAAVHFLPEADAAPLLAALAGEGLRASRHELYHGGAEARALCDRIRREVPLPADVALVRVGPDTPAAVVDGIGAVSMACGVFPVSGRHMRGLGVPGVCLAAVTGAGEVVATASAYANVPSDRPHSAYGFWGMLATHPDRRGQGLALRLGAEALIHAQDTLGIRRVYSGVGRDNPVSDAVCRKMGVTPSGMVMIGAMDPAQFEGQGLTR